MTKEQKDIINNHFSEIPREMEIFKKIIDIGIDDEDKKQLLLAMIDKMESECSEVKTIIKNL